MKKQMFEKYRKAVALVMAIVLMVTSGGGVVKANTETDNTESNTKIVINIDKQIGENDLSTAWWSAFSDHYKIEDGRSYEFNFDVHGSSNTWNNYLMVFTNEAAIQSLGQSEDYVEYAIVRADNWGWGGGNNCSLNGEAITYSNSLNEAGMTNDDWSVFRDIMTDATVSLDITRNGNDITTIANVSAKEDASKSFVYTASFVAGYADGKDAADVYMTLTVDESCITPVNTDATEASETGSANTTTDFSRLETQPVVKYTFDDETGLTLAGEAKIANGVLNLAKDSDSYGTTYAQIADFTSYDFSNGVTLIADVNVAAYSSDWTSIFTIGDGTIGGAGADSTGLYHFTQGFSSVGGLTANNNYFEGYFGNAVSRPYVWDYFSNADNRDKWYTFAVTISSDSMTTYVNGQAVQTAEGDYTNILSVFNTATNNYLGVSYWSSDPDFAGSLDNIGIYNTALSAEDIYKLSTMEEFQSSDWEYQLLEDGTVRITGYNGSEKYVVVPEYLGGKKVTRIDGFYNCKNLYNIELPDTITHIDDSAFSGCSSLISVKMPSSLLYIGDSAFLQCTSLNSIKLPSELTSIGFMAFAGCINLNNVELPDTVTYLGEGAFEKCALRSVILPDGLTSMEASVFFKCTSLTYMKIPTSMTAIGVNAIPNLSTLTVQCEKDSYAYQYITENCPLVKIAAEETYTISYNANGGSGEPSFQTKYYEIPLTLSTKIPVRKGYKFLGWAKNRNATIALYQPASDYINNESIMLYAVWEKELDVTDYPTVTEKPAVTETPTVTEIAMVTEIPTVTETPIVTETPTVTEVPTVTAAPSDYSDSIVDGDNKANAETAENESKVKVSGSTYEVQSSSTVTYTASKKSATTVSIPTTIKIDGSIYEVTSIAANAFKNNKTIKKVTITQNISKIGKNAFKGCKNLKTIVIKSKKLKASKLGKNIFTGISSNAVVKVPKSKVKVYRKIFRKKGLSKKVKVKALKK